MVHPRSRGGALGAFTLPECHKGSSPLARGRPAHAAPEFGMPGFIPARAGEPNKRM